MKSVILLLTTCTCLVRCVPPPHPDVEAVRREEELLPPVFKSPALHNPHLRELLSLTSLLHNGEKLVFDREAHDVSRKEIYNILTHAGFIPRKRFPPSSHKANEIPGAFQIPTAWNLYEPSHFPSQDILQHL